MFDYETNKKNTSFQVLLPNLIYKNDELYFKSKYPMKIKQNNKFEYKNDFLLKDVNLERKINIRGMILKCKILDKSIKNDVISHIEINTTEYISKIDMQKYAKEFESVILNINLDDNNSSQSCDNDENNNISYDDEEYYSDT